MSGRGSGLPVQGVEGQMLPLPSALTTQTADKPWLSETILFAYNDPAVSYFHPQNDVCETTRPCKKSLPLGMVPLVATCENRNN